MRGNTSPELGDIDPRRRKRCYHRVICGLERGGSLRLITLTSSDNAPGDIQRSFRKCIMRLKRRQLLKDYIKVIEVKDDGRQHIHLCYRGEYIEQAALSAMWQEIHHSPIVDIRRVKAGRQSKRGVAGYLAKYMAKEMVKRYSWSWHWVYPGFVKTWREAKRVVVILKLWLPAGEVAGALLKLWRSHIRALSPPEKFLQFLEEQVEILRRRLWHARFVKDNSAS